MFKKAFVLIGDDLRLSDNPALSEAIKLCGQSGAELAVIYNYQSNYTGRELGGAAKVFLHHCLKAFAAELKARLDIELYIFNLDIDTLISKLFIQHGFDAIFYNRPYIKHHRVKIEAALAKARQSKNLECFNYKAQTLFEYGLIKTGSGEDFKVFTPFWKACLKSQHAIGNTIAAPDKASINHAHIEGENLKNHQNLDTLELLPFNQGNWHKNLASYWSFDYAELNAKIEDFIENKLQDYKENRNLTYIKGCSNLSPYVRFGFVSVREVFNRVMQSDKISDQYLAELGWREFACHVAFANDHLQNQELRQNFATFRWEQNFEHLKAWQKGVTGFEIVDAGMKELYATGQMHNRVRMISASFLVKDLLINWRAGEEYFWDTLVDACPAVNPFSWQWVFGSGYDAAPYFRIFNPDTQRERFDPNFEYCKKWLGKNFALGGDARIVSHEIQRDKANRLYALIK